MYFPLYHLSRGSHGLGELRKKYAVPWAMSAENFATKKK
jgi:hypothetical protein